jgi:hypothetical protein
MKPSSVRLACSLPRRPPAHDPSSPTSRHLRLALLARPPTASPHLRASQGRPEAGGCEPRPRRVAMELLTKAPVVDYSGKMKKQRQRGSVLGPSSWAQVDLLKPCPRFRPLPTPPRPRFRCHQPSDPPPSSMNCSSPPPPRSSGGSRLHPPLLPP